MKKLLKLSSLLLVAMFLFTACAPATPAAPVAEPAPAAPAPAAPAPAAPAPAAPAAEPAPEAAPAAPADPMAIEEGASLVYWSMWSDTEPQAIVISEAAAAFEAQTGVHVEITFNGRQIQRSGLEPALSAGQAIDLFDEDVDRVTDAWAPYLLNLDSYANAVYPETGGAPYASLLNQTLMNIAKDAGGGSYTAIPYQPSLFTVMYNKKLFDQAGVTALPKTWDEFKAVCAQLVAAGITPITVDNAYIAALFGYTLDRVVGAEKVAEMLANSDFTDPGILRTCQIWEEMIQLGYVSPKAATNVYPEGQASEIAAETVAMYLNGTWLPNEVKSINPDITWGSFAYPAIDAGGDGTEAHNIGAQCYAINKNTAYPNAAFAFIRFMTSGEYDQKLSSETMGIPMANDATWPAELAEAKAVFDGSSKRLVWAVGMESDLTNAPITEGFQLMVTGSMNAQQFADSLAAIGQ